MRLQLSTDAPFSAVNPLPKASGGNIGFNAKTQRRKDANKRRLGSRSFSLDRDASSSPPAVSFPLASLRLCVSALIDQVVPSLSANLILVRPAPKPRFWRKCLRKDVRAFTLIEVVISASLMAMILVSGYVCLNAASSASTRSLSSRIRIGCVSGSPNRQLNSSTIGPRAVIISPQ